MSIYHSIYYNLVSRNVNNKLLWEDKNNNLHRHHIIPRHMGGSDEEDNYTYLSVREHQIAHYLLWKIHGKVNDLRAMHMLGANLTSYQRHLTGVWCRDNKIGFFNEKWDDVRREWSLRAQETLRKEKKCAYYNEEKHREVCSKGGKAGAKSQMRDKTGIHDPANFKKNAILGGKAIKGMICVTNGTHRTRIKPEKLDEYLENGYRRGFTLSS